MGSLWYRSTNKPRNLDDCLDLARNTPISGACLHLRYNELIREQYFMTQLLARFDVKYGDKTHVVEELCGGYLHTCSEHNKQTEIDRANARLKELTEKLSGQGIVLANSDQQFKYCPSAKRKLPVRDNPYERFAGTDLILRDQLAIDRTVLANERTFLAYARTSLALILTGAACLKFFDSLFSDITGWTLIALGIVVAGIGVWRSVTMARNIGRVNM
jgi:putative membrane protein